MSQKSIFSRNLNTLMKNQGMTVREAAKIAGVAVSTIQNWRSGSSPNDYVAVRKLANSLQTSLAWLLTGEHDTSGGAQQILVGQATHEERPFFSGYAYVTLAKIMDENSRSSQSPASENTDAIPSRQMPG